MRQFCLLIVLLATGCDSREPAPPPTQQTGGTIVIGETTLLSTRIFFGHQSVGRDILAGISGLAPELPITNAAAGVDGPALIEANIGENGDAGSKDRAFLEAVRALDPGQVAIYKYCYVDMSADTDPDALFADYQGTLTVASATGVRAIPVTMPITTVAPSWKRGIKQLLGKPTDLELNARRQHFNELLREAYADGPLIDLARFEATREDGSIRTAPFNGQPVEVLVAAYTDDGAHLNSRGRRWVAARFLESLSNAIDD